MKGTLIAAGGLAILAVVQNVEARNLEDILKEKGILSEAEYSEISKYRPSNSKDEPNIRNAKTRGLADILKEKGIISEADYNEVTGSKQSDSREVAVNKQSNYKPGNGFTFTSSDEKFQISLGFRMLARYLYLDKGLTSGADGAGKTVSDVTNTSTFSLPKTSLWLQGYAFSRDITYRLQMDLAQAGNNKMLEYAYLKYRFLDELQLLAGQNKLPSSRQYMSAAGTQQFVDAAGATRAFQTSYDPGIYLSGSFLNDRIGYNVSYTSGVGQTTVRSTSDNAVLARLQLNPSGAFAFTEADPEYSSNPLFTVGTTYFHDTLSEKNGVFEQNNMGFAQTTGWLGKNISHLSTRDFADKIRIDQLNADMAFKWKGISAQGEYYWGQGKGTMSNVYVHSRGFYIQSGFFIIPRHLEVAMRYSFTDPNIALTDDNQAEVTGAVSYYFYNHNLKIQSDIGNVHTQGAQTDLITRRKKPADDMQYRMQFTLMF